MPYEMVGWLQRLPLFALVASRLGAMLMFQPIWNAMSIPMRFRALATMALAALVVPMLPPLQAPPASIGAFAIALGGELLLGFVLGLTLQICFVGLQIGGLMIAQQSGLAFGQIADPSTGAQQSIVSSFYLNLAAVIYLVLDGHRALLRVSLDSFRAIPLLTDTDRLSGAVNLLLSALELSGEIAVRLAAPAMITVFLVTVAIGFVSRTMPQLNVATIGFSLKALLAFLIMAISLPTGIAAFVDGLDRVGAWLTRFLAI